MHSTYISRGGEVENWEKAYEDKENGLKYKEIADKYDVSINTVKSWKQRYWNKKDIEKACIKSNVGGAPPGNENSLKHGIYSKILSDEEIDSIKKQDIDLMYELRFEVAYSNARTARIEQRLKNIDDTDLEIKYYEAIDRNRKLKLKYLEALLKNNCDNDDVHLKKLDEILRGLENAAKS